MDGSSGGSPLNVINNYYKPGPVTNLDAPISYRIVKVEGGGRGGGNDVRPALYVEGNVVEGNEKVTADHYRFVIERNLNPRLQSPSASFISDIVGAQAYAAGDQPPYRLG